MGRQPSFIELVILSGAISEKPARSLQCKGRPRPGGPSLDKNKAISPLVWFQHHLLESQSEFPGGVMLLLDRNVINTDNPPSVQGSDRCFAA